MAQRNKRILQIGDVLGMDFELPEGLKRLNGWLVYNFTKQGIPQALEPLESAPEGGVSWYAAGDHIRQTLKKDNGHTGARLWTVGDGSAIFNNIVQGGHNNKAQLDVSGSYPLGRYWESTEFVLGPGGAVARCLHVDLARDWRSRNDVARVRAVLDVPALARQL